MKASTSARENGAPKKLRDRFNDLSRHVSNAVGTVWAFVAAVGVVVVWVISGPLFHFSDTWQLVINTGTTIVTFIMVFLIQSTQNRDSKAVHLKLDELIRAIGSARNDLVDLEKLSEDELETIAKQFDRLHKRACDLKMKRAENSKAARGSASRHKSTD